MKTGVIILLFFGGLFALILFRPKARTSTTYAGGADGSGGGGGLNVQKVVDNNQQLLATKAADEAAAKQREDEMRALQLKLQADEAAAKLLEAQQKEKERLEKIGPPFTRDNGTPWYDNEIIGYIYTIRLANPDGSYKDGGPQLICTTHEGAYGLGKYRVGVLPVDQARVIDSSQSSIKNQWHLMWHQGFVRIGARNGVADPVYRSGKYEWPSGGKFLCFYNAGEGPLEMLLATDYHQHYWDVAWLQDQQKHGSGAFQIAFACNFHAPGCDTDYGLVVRGNQVYVGRGRSNASWWTTK